MVMERLKISVFIIWFSASYVFGIPYLWEGQTPQLRLYVPDENLKKTWRTKEMTSGIELFYDTKYDPRKPTLFLAHGWFQGAEDMIIVMLIDSLFEVKFYQKMNIMVLDAPWFLDSIISNISYFAPAKNLEMLGNIVGDMFNKAIRQGLIKPEDINLVGLSLGAHLSGYIGRAVLGQVHSIVGLDPAGPGFDSTLQSMTKFQHVSRTDAQFVHLYHTNSMTFGTSQRLGTADFEFNEGFSQPGCALSIDPKCSHKRAFYIFNDLILGDKGLIALRCNNHSDFKNCNCQGNSTVSLQYPVDTRAESIHFLNTKDEAPFGLGQEGITCWKDQQDTLKLEKENERSNTASVLMEITENLQNHMEFLKKKDTYLALFNLKNSSEE